MIIGLKGYRSFDPPAKTIVWYLIIATIANIVGVSLAVNNYNNMPVFHVFTVMEFLVFTLFFRYLADSQKAKKILSLFMVAFLLFGIVNAIYIQPIYTYNSISRSVESLLLIAFSLASFYRSLGENNPTVKKTKNLIWINIGIICYFSGALFLFIFSEYIAKDASSYRIGWIIHAVLVATFLYSMITVYLIKAKNR